MGNSNLLDICHSGVETECAEQVQAHCDTVPIISPTCPVVQGYTRLLLQEEDEDLHRKLYELVEGDEQRRMLLDRDSSKSKSYGVCHNPNSKLFCQHASHEDCMDPNNWASEEERELAMDSGHCDLSGSAHPNVLDDEPWLIPSAGNAKLLAANPGIWTVDNFLDQSELHRVATLIEKYGINGEMFGPCKTDSPTDSSPHPRSGKECFKISPETVCAGPYSICPRIVGTDGEDAVFLQHLFDKVNKVLQLPKPIDSNIKIQNSFGGTPPVDLHVDPQVLTFNVYLSDGGANIIFPNADVQVTPKAGMALTFLNHHKGGYRNPMADHAVQAHPENVGNRTILHFEFRPSPEEFASLFREPTVIPYL